MSEAPTRIPIGISSCLLGHEVRFDGGHKHDRYVTGTLGRYFEFVPFCPEAAIGLGIPRPPIRLTGDPVAPRAVRVDDPGVDVTDRLVAYAGEIAPQCAHLRGYLFKRGSPSCGMERVKVYRERGQPPLLGTGLHAAAVMKALPDLPCEEEGRLNDAPLRESFIERVFVYDRWKHLVDAGLSAGRLVDFHTRHKFLLLSHSEKHYRELGRLVAGAGSGSLDEVARQYVSMLMDGLRHRATRRRHANVLQHLAGFLKRRLDADDKAEFAKLVDDYRLGNVPLVAPMTLLRHHFRRNPHEYVSMQYYLEPCPDDLGIRNHL